MVADKKNNHRSSIGESLKLAREKRGLTVQEVAENIQVRSLYLEYLEKGEYRKLPADVYSRGFLKRYAEFLNLSSEEIVDFFKKEKKVFDSIYDRSEENKPSSFGDFISRIYITRKAMALLIFLLIVIILIGYFWYQVSFLLASPNLILENPTRDIEVFEESIHIIGRADYNSFVKINNQNIILNDDGSFDQEINLKSGLNTLEIKAVNRLDKESRVIRRVVYKTIEN